MRWSDVHAKLLDRSRDAQGLTPSQSGAAVMIVGALDRGVTYLNLWGPPGVGKTFLARHLVQNHGGLYLSSPDQPLVETTVDKWLCVDNVRATRTDARAIYSRLHWQRATAVLILTESAVPDTIYSVQMQLTGDDFSIVRATLLTMFRHVSLPPPDGNYPSLWTFVRACTRLD